MTRPNPNRSGNLSSNISKNFATIQKETACSSSLTSSNQYIGLFTFLKTVFVYIFFPKLSLFTFVCLLFFRYDHERFRCTTGSWSIPVTLVIGSRQGISYTTDSAGLFTFFPKVTAVCLHLFVYFFLAVTATHMTEFSHIQSIQTLEASGEKLGTHHHKGAINKYRW